MMELRAPKAGELITARFLDALAKAMLKRLLGGTGITIEHRENGTIVRLSNAQAFPTARWQEYRGE